MFSAISYSYIKMKVGGADYVRKQSLEAINAVTGFARVLQTYEKPKLKFKRMRKYKYYAKDNPFLLFYN